jgi:hypothetical protein
VIWLTRQQAALAFGVKVSCVRHWVGRGHVTERVRGGVRQVDGASVLAYLDSRGEVGQHRKG